MFRLILLALALLTGASAQTFPGIPVYTFNGPLSCGARMYAAGQLQTYCYLTLPGAARITLCNHVETVNPSAPPLTIIAQGMNACQFTALADLNAGTSGTVYFVSWMIWQPIPGGPVQYQIGYGQMLCTVDSAGTCEVTANNGGRILTGAF